ncbi:MAG: PAS domain S-box protein [Cyanobacteriota bacterium]|nr:PAS domain S-box protein [Cyanobacteriota bacterium]
MAEDLATGITQVSSDGLPPAAGAPQALLDLALRHGAVGMALVTPSGRFLAVNEALCRLLGRSESSLLAMELRDVTHPDDLAPSQALVEEMVAGVRESFQLEKRYLHADGRLIWGQVSVSCLRQQAEPTCLFLVQILDVSEARRELLVRVPSTDPITGLPWRQELIAQLEEALADHRDDQGTLAVLSIGIDRLSQVNDALTHQAGDLLLATLASRLLQALDPPCPLARGTGDTYLVLLEGLRCREEAAAIAERLRVACKGTLSFAGQAIEPSVSIGIAVADAHQGADELLRDASLAMRQASARGRDCVAFGERHGSEEARRELALLADLRTALEADELQAWFMPVVDLASGELCGYEALVRWPRADGSVLLPDRFLPVARRANLASAIDCSVIRQSIAALARLPEGLRVAANVTPTTLGQKDLAETVRGWLQEAGVPAGRLQLEITETALLSLSPAVRDTIERLAALGVRWLIDDFGTGFSSISHLRDLPVHGIKLDRSFTTGIGLGDQKSVRLAQALAGLAEGLGLDTVAEGVETAAKAASLLDLGWHKAQGYLYGEAAPLVGSPPASGRPDRPTPTSSEREASEAKSRSRWALAVTDNVPVGLYAMRIKPGEDPQFLFVSRRWLEMTKLSRSRVLNDARLALERVHPDDRPGFLAIWDARIAGGEPLQWEGRLLIEGSTRWVRIEGLPQIQVDGSCVWQGVMSDITERKQQELDLRRILDNAPIAIAANSLTDPDPAITYLNREFLRIYGYDSDTIPTLSAWAQLAYPDPAYRTEVMERWRTALDRARREEGTVERIEAQVTTADGRRLDVMFSAVVLDTMLLVSMLDITDRRQAEQQRARARAEQAETALAITEAIPVGTYTMVLPRDGGMASFGFMSDRFLAIAGLDRETAAANPLNVFACVHPDDYDSWLQRNQEVFAGKLPFYGETRIVVDGEVRWISAESIPRDLPDGSTIWEGVLIDITERIRAQQQLREERERLQLLAENATDVVIKLGLTGQVEWVSTSIAAVLGWQPGEVVGKPIADLVSPDDHALLREIQVDPEPTVVHRIEIRLLRCDGGSRWMALTLRPVCDPQGQRIAQVGGLRDIHQEVIARQAMAREKLRLATTLDSLLDPHLSLGPVRNPEGRIVDFLCLDANLAACGDLERPREGVIGSSLLQLLPTCGETGLLARFAEVMESGDPLALNEVPIPGPHHGEERRLDLRVVRVSEGLSCSWRDVSERFEAARRLAASEEKYRLLAENSSDVVMQISDDGLIRWVSPSLEPMLGWRPEEWIGRRGTDFLEHRGDAERFRRNQEKVRAGQTIVARDRVLARDGTWRWTETHASAFRAANGVIDGMVASFRTIDGEVEAEQALARQARTDSLTGLPNRRDTFARLAALTGAATAAGRPLALAFCDLDHFKAINDRHGHAAGDALLLAVSERMRQVVRRTDVVGRIGGDELLVLLDGVDGLEEALGLAETLRRQARQPVEFAGRSFAVTLSIGVTLFRPGESVDALVARADAAMYEAKQSGRDRVIAIPAECS